jgi:hypothetical protein
MRAFAFMRQRFAGVCTAKMSRLAMHFSQAFCLLYKALDSQPCEIIQQVKIAFDFWSRPSFYA